MELERFRWTLGDVGGIVTIGSFFSAARTSLKNEAAHKPRASAWSAGALPKTKKIKINKKNAAAGSSCKITCTWPNL